MKSVRKEILFPQELFNLLQEIAIQKGITLSALIKMYLIKCLKEEKNEKQI